MGAATSQPVAQPRDQQRLRRHLGQQGRPARAR
jgi:hypothetical protein